MENIIALAGYRFLLVLFWIYLSLLLPNYLFGQDIHHEMDSNFVGEADNLAITIKEGKVEFHMRSFYMQTNNRGDLLDYSTLALGGGLGYYSPSFKGFHLGFSGFFVFQLYEQNIRVPDPSTGNANRYEILLYDMNDFDNSKDLDRLELLYLSYLKNDFQAVFGRQKVNSPLLNEQDNRMRPNIFSGLTLKYSPVNWKYTAAWYSHVTMRGTVDWYTVGDSFGVYPFGRNAFGTDSNYKGNVRTKGIGVFGIDWEKEHLARIQVWNYMAENVFNLHFVQVDKSVNVSSISLDFGVQGFYQYPLGSGGNREPEKTYVLPDEKSTGFGMKFGASSLYNSISLNLLRIGKQGRFLFPREWGREQFYASLSRERFEGNGNLNAITLKYDWKSSNKIWKGALGISSVGTPDINDFSLNKYGLPSYYHFAGAVDYRFSGYLEGMDLKLLLVNKSAKNKDSVLDGNRINRVDLINMNLIIDYKF